MKTRQGHKRKNESEVDDKSDPDYQPSKQARASKETDVKQQRLEHARKFAEAKRESQIKRMEIKSSRLQAERDTLRRQVQWLQDQVLHRLPSPPAAQAPMPDPPDVPPAPDAPAELDAPVEVDNAPPEAPVKVDNVPPEAAKLDAPMLESKVQASQAKWQVIHSATIDVPRSVLLRGKGCKGLPDEYLNKDVGVPIRIVQAPDDPSRRCLVAADLYLVCQMNKVDLPSLPSPPPPTGQYGKTSQDARHNRQSDGNESQGNQVAQRQCPDIGWHSSTSGRIENQVAIWQIQGGAKGDRQSWPGLVEQTGLATHGSRRSHSYILRGLGIGFMNSDIQM